jgi:5-methyltetrahydropteroyltriglutamate--homocysteine methyltransferase
VDRGDGKAHPKEGGFIAEEVRFLRSITERQIKATVPAPALLGERLWDRQASAGAYGDPSDFVRDCIPILRREIELIVDAGADFIQIDDPHLCLFVDPEVRARYDDAAADFAVETVNALVDGVKALKSPSTSAEERGLARGARRNTWAVTRLSSPDQSA